MIESIFRYLFFRKFRIVSVGFETVLFVSVVSIQVRNTETNRKSFFLVSQNKPKQTRNRSCFGLFRFEPKNFFFHFEDTLARTDQRPPSHLNQWKTGFSLRSTGQSLLVTLTSENILGKTGFNLKKQSTKAATPGTCRLKLLVTPGSHGNYNQNRFQLVVLEHQCSQQLEQTKACCLT